MKCTFYLYQKGIGKMLIGNKDGKNYYLEQNPLTKELRIEVDALSTGKRRTYTNKKIIRKIFCMFV